MIGSHLRSDAVQKQMTHDVHMTPWLQFLKTKLLAGKGDKVCPSKYDLIGNVVHDGKPGAGGTYRLHIHRKSEDAWYEVQDLRVTDILPQMVALSETYMQVYELKAQA